MWSLETDNIEKNPDGNSSFGVMENWLLSTIVKMKCFKVYGKINCKSNELERL